MRAFSDRWMVSQLDSLHICTYCVLHLSDLMCVGNIKCPFERFYTKAPPQDSHPNAPTHKPSKFFTFTVNKCNISESKLP